MSETAANNSAIVLLDHHQHSHHRQTTPPTPAPPPPPPPLAGASPSTPTSPSTSVLIRDYRKGNWTIQETLILINAKRLDDERRVQRQIGGGGAPGTPRTAELRWKWVENYCWKNGCLRSQNQCNDKWDNLLRDYKKVREYETKVANEAAVASGSESRQPVSYWSMEKHERKDRNLPSNLAYEVFEALTDVLTRRSANRSGISISAAATPVTSCSPQQTAAAILPQLTACPPPPLPPAPNEEPEQPRLVPSPPQLSAPAPTVPAVPANQSLSVEMSSESSGTAEGGKSGGSVGHSGEAKRRRVGKSVVRGASVLARTLMACEEKREKRHRDLMELEQRRLRIEEDQTEINRQGFAGLISAVNNLSGTIHALVSQHRHLFPDQR